MKKPQGTILITGATGFIGTRLTQRLLDDGFSVRCMVRRTTTAMPDGAKTVQALYLPEGVKAEDVLSDVPKRLEISYLVSIKGPDFDKGAAPVMERNQTPAELARLQGRIDRINAAYRDVKSGGRYSLTYLPGRGTELALNGTPLIVIEGADFAAAYFGIWLGREPIDEKLKRDLLKGR